MLAWNLATVDRGKFDRHSSNAAEYPGSPGTKPTPCLHKGVAESLVTFGGYPLQKTYSSQPALFTSFIQRKSCRPDLQEEEVDKLQHLRRRTTLMKEGNLNVYHHQLTTGGQDLDAALTLLALSTMSKAEAEVKAEREARVE